MPLFVSLTKNFLCIFGLLSLVSSSLFSNIDYQIHSYDDLRELPQALLKGARRFKFDPHYLPSHPACALSALRHQHANIRRTSSKSSISGTITSKTLRDRSGDNVLDTNIIDNSKDFDTSTGPCLLLNHDTPSVLYNTFNSSDDLLTALSSDWFNQLIDLDTKTNNQNYNEIYSTSSERNTNNNKNANNSFGVDSINSNITIALCFKSAPDFCDFSSARFTSWLSLVDDFHSKAVHLQQQGVISKRIEFILDGDGKPKSCLVGRWLPWSSVWIIDTKDVNDVYNNAFYYNSNNNVKVHRSSQIDDGIITNKNYEFLRSDKDSTSVHSNIINNNNNNNNKVNANDEDNGMTSSSEDNNDFYRYRILNNPENVSNWQWMASAEVNYGKFAAISDTPYQLWEPDAEADIQEYIGIYRSGSRHDAGFHFAINIDIAMFRLFRHSQMKTNENGASNNVTKDINIVTKNNKDNDKIQGLHQPLLFRHPEKPKNTNNDNNDKTNTQQHLSTSESARLVSLFQRDTHCCRETIVAAVSVSQTGHGFAMQLLSVTDTPEIWSSVPVVATVGRAYLTLPDIHTSTINNNSDNVYQWDFTDALASVLLLSANSTTHDDGNDGNRNSQGMVYYDFDLWLMSHKGTGLVVRLSATFQNDVNAATHTDNIDTDSTNNWSNMSLKAMASRHIYHINSNTNINSDINASTNNASDESTMVFDLRHTPCVPTAANTQNNFFNAQQEKCFLVLSQSHTGGSLSVARLTYTHSNISVEIIATLELPLSVTTDNNINSQNKDVTSAQVVQLLSDQDTLLVFVAQQELIFGLTIRLLTAVVDNSNNHIVHEDNVIVSDWVCLMVGTHISADIAPATISNSNSLGSGVASSDIIMVLSSEGYCYNSHSHNTRSGPSVCSSVPVSTEHVLDYSLGIARDWLHLLSSTTNNSKSTVTAISNLGTKSVMTPVLSVCHPSVLHGTYDLGDVPHLLLLGPTNHNDIIGGYKNIYNNIPKMLSLQQGFDTTANYTCGCGEPVRHDGWLLASFDIHDWIQTLLLQEN